MSIRKAIFPVAGLGTRFLPATKSIPKEMMPVVDKPLVQYAVEEAKNAGIEEFIFVVSANKDAIVEHFGVSASLERALQDAGKSSLVASIRDCQLETSATHFIIQEHALGLGHAIWCARHLIDSEPFAVILPDDLVLSAIPCLKQMVSVHGEHGGNLLAVMDVRRQHTGRYGILIPGEVHNRLIEVKGLVEKPKPLEAPSQLAIIGRYILQPQVLNQLGIQQRDVNGEIQLTDAIASLLGETTFYGFRFEGKRYDCGDKVGFLEANMAYALAREELQEDVAAAVLRVANSIEST